MYCQKCGTQLGSRLRYCPGCGTKRSRRFSFVRFLGFLCFVTALGFGGVIYYIVSMDKEPEARTASQPVVQDTPVAVKEETASATAAPPKKLAASEQQVLTDIVKVSQQGVYTIFTDYGQGSGFLINEKGDVATNAHVVEGTVSVIVKDIEGVEHEGTVIGYSNQTDIALVRVPDLAGRPPLKTETAEKAQVGEEVIALGSPLALENTATFGYITGVDRSFVIDPHSYENIYQTSAAIAPGSSGGPLISKKTGRVIAINSAKLTGEEAIGFSIPFKDVTSMLAEWSQSPLSAEEVNSLFYTEDGLLFFEEYWNDDAYFEGGEYTEDEAYSSYDIPEEWWYTEELPEDAYTEEEFYEENSGETVEEEVPYIEPDGYEEEMVEEVPADDLPVLEEEPFEEPIYEEEPAFEENVEPVIEDENGDGIIDVEDVTEDFNMDGVIDELDLNELLMMQ